eukprot:CAMPEP_0201130404 /NCGR_PEP_ID=MMETSP0850-20130426/39777_1 /ASSEMBLY_ACC=CAM_ASM_000622 /TAXON_ID=183588 /ORGANISM="Pseudo-nitzschia fraudulenta, Strain WWA7" /LENGTH=200 /DNA_ID=CAMNT_0047400159 /DNA_START=104 /DNA_END=706 /DNA_ORIENTATION=-
MLSSAIRRSIPKRIQTISSRSRSSNTKLTIEERNDAVSRANKAMKGYTQTRILAKQGKLPSKNRRQSEEHRSANAIQFSLFITLGIAFVVSPILGRKIAHDDEFREKYVPDWYDFRVKPPKSAWTRKELHDQIVDVERDMRERAIKGDFTPEKLEELKQTLQPRSDLSNDDISMAKKYGWGAIHPGVDPDDYDEDEDDDL